MSILGIIGGSGIYNLEKIGRCKKINVKTSWGEPSDLITELQSNNNKKIYFIPRHGEDHSINPTQVNYRANIAAFKEIGVTDLISISAVGSLKNNIKPGSFVIINQYIDKTFKRENTFFDKDLIAHVSMAKPNSESLSKICHEIIRELNYDFHSNVSYVAIEGPQLSTHMESKNNHDQGFDVVGMTNMPEAKLAREAEIRYQSIGMVTDYDCYTEDLCMTDVQEIILTMNQMKDKASNIIKALTNSFDKYALDSDDILTCLDKSIITDIEKVSEKTKDDLKFIIKRYLYKMSSN